MTVQERSRPLSTDSSRWARWSWPRRIAAISGVILLTYLGVGNLLHHVIFPMPSPDPATYPQPGDRFGSRAEGFETHVIAVENGMLRGELVVHPHAEGPPVHYHRGFDEVFAVKEGTLHLQVGDDVLQVRAGDRYRVPAGTPHRPFNPSDARVVIADETSSIPQSFAACLVQLYDFLDARGTADPGLDMALQMSVIDPICDTHLTSPPAPVQAITKAVLAPAARLAGYRNYDPARSLHPQGGRRAASKALGHR